MAQDLSLLDNIDVIDLHLFDTNFQIEELLADVSFSEANSTFNFLNATPPPQFNYPVWPVCDDYGSLPSSDLEGNLAEEESHSEEDARNGGPVKKRKKVSNFDKPPEPYADMIAKAIMSSGTNLMQLKDIYSYISINYAAFTSKVEVSKWKSAIRHNLSSHSFFIKTLQKNSQGHFWSIEANFLSILKEKGSTVGIKKCLGKKTNLQKPKPNKQKKTGETFVPGSIAPLDQDAYYYNCYNDSAFFSSTENDSSQHSSSSGYQNYKFLSATQNACMPQASYSLDNANVNYVHLSNQLTY
ncbi:forkhead box D3-B-like [Brachionus plicatilis]|uniref:Forkhead box D3-B-like n=1 Tax=Brachionus plicatilis TaxID=10195 RepID=A0A3M7RP31_BRAPC|nr:forkhead box D3-B-like [Brachionus plicatilis]